MHDRARNLSSIYRSPDAARTVADCHITGPWCGEWLAWLAQDRTMQSLNGFVLYLPAQDSPQQRPTQGAGGRQYARV